jgi:thiamine kinase-like enzyme
MRAFDIANFLCELCFSYNSQSSVASGFTADFRRFLAPTARQLLYAAYWRFWGSACEELLDEVHAAASLRDSLSHDTAIRNVFYS